ncbi:MAG TPA: class I SAM-dependent methyltransferase [Terriglobales bacterium]|nr:class I SAM-dependent methyltransferase [Terriglobales bacterium]
MAAPQLATMEGRATVDCRICGSSSFFPYLQGRGYQIVECLECGLRYINPQPTDRELREFYAGFDLDSTWRGDGEERFDRAMRDFVLQFRRSGSVLDVGSSRGNFLLAMRAAGFSVFGVEPSPKNSEFARSANGIDSYTGTIEEFLAAPTRRPFDVITVLNVIEHVPDPKQVLTGLRELLVSCGLLILAVPDARLHSLIGGTRQKLGFGDPFWMHTRKHPLVGFDPPAHLCSFEPKTISQLTEKCGFQTLGVRNAPVIINQDVWKNVAKILLHGLSECLYLASLGRVVLGYSTMLAARKMG